MGKFKDMLFKSFCEGNKARASWQLVSQSTRQNIHDWQSFMKEKIEKDIIGNHTFKS